MWILKIMIWSVNMYVKNILLIICLQSIDRHRCPHQKICCILWRIQAKNNEDQRSSWRTVAHKLNVVSLFGLALISYGHKLTWFHRISYENMKFNYWSQIHKIQCPITKNITTTFEFYLPQKGSNKENRGILMCFFIFQYKNIKFRFFNSFFPPYFSTIWIYLAIYFILYIDFANHNKLPT